MLLLIVSSGFIHLNSAEFKPSPWWFFDFLESLCYGPQQYKTSQKQKYGLLCGYARYAEWARGNTYTSTWEACFMCSRILVGFLVTPMDTPSFQMMLARLEPNINAPLVMVENIQQLMARHSGQCTQIEYTNMLRLFYLMKTTHDPVKSSKPPQR